MAVCPTGIDIRDGYQLECIGCARCIDACDGIMDRVQRPKGLIRYDSLARLGGEHTRFLRPRVVIYSALLAGIVVALFIGLGTRPGLGFAVLRPPGDPFQSLQGGVVSNHFTLRLHNRSMEPRAYRLQVTGVEDASLIVPVNPVPVPAGEQHRTEAFVNLHASRLENGKAPIRIQVYEGEQLLTERTMTLLGPVAPRQ